MFVNHVTAPVEVQETELTTLYGRPDNENKKVIGYVKVNNQWQTVYSCVPEESKFNDADSIINVPHSHNFRNLPLKLVDNNASVRTAAMPMNKGTAPVVAGAVSNGKKTISKVELS